MSIDLDDYNDVPGRLADLEAKHPEASLQGSYEIVQIADQWLVVYTARCYRTPGDERPGVGTAQEPFPGKTPYTRGSEIQNAETSAWGRAIVAALAAKSKKVATREDVERRQADHAADDVCSALRAEIAKVGKERGLDLPTIASDFQAVTSGGDIRVASEDDLRRYLHQLRTGEAA